MYKLLFVLLSLCFSVSNASSLVGTTVPPYPDGVDSKSGACISKALGLMRVCDFSIGILEDSAGSLMSLYLGEKTGRNKAGQTTWKILDQLPYPKVSQTQTLIMTVCGLVKGEEIDESIIAIAEITDAEWLTNIKWAYKGDFTKGKFVQLDVKDVKCVNDAIGIE